MVNLFRVTVINNSVRVSLFKRNHLRGHAPDVPSVSDSGEIVRQ